MAVHNRLRRGKRRSPKSKVREAGLQQGQKSRSCRSLSRSFNAVRKLVGKKFPTLKKTKLNTSCPHVKKAHSHHQIKNSDGSGKAWRNFMHTAHFDNTICAHPHAESEVTMGHQVGLLLHEFGHLICDLTGTKNTQACADRMIKKHFGITIQYTEPGRLQYAEVA